MKKINTRQKMIEAALSLFHEQGVNGTSVDAVLKRSGTGKSQFSHYFKTKNGLVLAVLEYFQGQMEAGAYSTVPAIRTWEDLEFWLRSFISWQKKVHFTLSCPIGTIGHDLETAQEDIRNAARKIFTWRRDFVACFFKTEQDAGRMKKDASPKELADFCYTIIQGGLWMSKIERNSRPFENAMNITLAYLKSMRKK